ncbi:MAG: hypothetical protein ACOYL3_00700 [Desulfuromonadaceae bacterium]
MRRFCLLPLLVLLDATGEAFAATVIKNGSHTSLETDAVIVLIVSVGGGQTTAAGVGAQATGSGSADGAKFDRPVF